MAQISEGFLQSRPNAHQAGQTHQATMIQLRLQTAELKSG